MSVNYSIKVYKEYFNFASSHFLIFNDGTREPLHGHNYRVKVMGDAPELKSDMVFDFLDIKPIVRRVCDSLDHKLLLPKNNTDLQILDQDNAWKIIPPDESWMIIPKSDILLIPIENTSAERLAIYICSEIKRIVKLEFGFAFSRLEIEVEETPGQSAIYREEQSLS